MRRAWWLLLACLLVTGCSRPQAGPWRPKLVVLLAIDTLRADHLGCADYPRPVSPNIDRLAREGVLFENEYSQGNQTVLSFPSIFTGLYPATADTFRQGLPPGRLTIASLLQGYGFETASFNGGGHLSPQFGLARGFDRYEIQRHFGWLRDSLPGALAWLRHVADGDARAFLFLHGYDPHSPYFKPLGFSRLWDPGYSGVGFRIARQGDAAVIDHVYYPDVHGPQLGGQRVQLTEEDERFVAAAYDGAVTWADLSVGVFMAELERLGLERDTVIFLIGDHGEQLFEHGGLGHGTAEAGAQLWHEEELHVPLIVWGPGGIPGGRRVHRLNEHIDLMPTILDLAGVPVPPDLPGHSLRGLLMGGAEDDRDRVAVSGSWPAVSIRDARYRLVSIGGSTQRAGLYDLTRDPREQVNLIDDPHLGSVAAGLLERFHAAYDAHHL